MMSGDLDEVVFDNTEHDDSELIESQLKASGKKPARKGMMQMTQQAIPKIEARSENKDDLVEESLSDGTGNYSERCEEEK